MLAHALISLIFSEVEVVTAVKSLPLKKGPLLVVGNKLFAANFVKRC